MNQDPIKDAWHLARIRIKCTWGKLSEDDIIEIAGSHEKLTLLLQSRYGYTRTVVDGMVSDFADRLT